MEPSELLVQGSASLACLMMDGKYIDEEVQYVWYHHPLKGLPPQDEEDQKKVDLNEMLEQGEMNRIRSSFLKEAREIANDDNF